jgi:hypothetical protein
MFAANVPAPYWPPPFLASAPAMRLIASRFTGVALGAFVVMEFSFLVTHRTARCLQGSIRAWRRETVLFAGKAAHHSRMQVRAPGSCGPSEFAQLG